MLLIVILSSAFIAGDDVEMIDMIWTIEQDRDKDRKSCSLPFSVVEHISHVRSHDDLPDCLMLDTMNTSTDWPD
jgi:hypothetical protein